MQYYILMFRKILYFDLYQTFLYDVVMELTTSGFGPNPTMQTCDWIYLSAEQSSSGAKWAGRSPGRRQDHRTSWWDGRPGSHEVWTNRFGFEEFSFPSKYHLICAGTLWIFPHRLDLSGEVTHGARHPWGSSRKQIKPSKPKTHLISDILPPALSICIRRAAP